MDMQYSAFTPCSHSSVTHVTQYASGSVVHEDVDKLALCMHIQGTVHLKKQFTVVFTPCSHMVTHGDMQVAIYYM